MSSEFLIVSTYKNRGDKSVYLNNRAIYLLVVAGEIIDKVFLARLIEHISDTIMPETQCGFRKGRSTADVVFASRQVLEKCREQHKDPYLGFLDLAKHKRPWIEIYYGQFWQKLATVINTSE